ncbi:MAG TPA: DUF362 domain-containing protein [Thermoanaerobaculia bacterium]|nr:DUF362 domain-containing protein [Thermoanaerobaculia bacterium]HUM30880.1 DUF362 domain-containing protein [Thermoanaerobaculia bacterium]HXK69191.1 DUF362 domain-containing protein [Thermoanaerobaculia bacterium]
MKDLNRREVLVGLAGMPLLLAAGKSPSKTPVIRLSETPTAANLSLGLNALCTGKSSFLKEELRPSDIVGIKLNCLAGRRLSPRPELVDSLVALLTEAGIKPSNIYVFDRSDRELVKAGFPLSPDGKGPRVVGINQDYEKEVSESGPVGSCYATLVTRTVTRLINVSVLKDHDLAGVSVGMKNFYGVIHNPNKYHMDACSPYVAHVVNHPSIRTKLVLTVIDASVAQYHGGPAYNPRYTWKEGAIYMARDPVALDAVGWDRIEKVRKEKGMASLKAEKREPAYIAAAQALGLGTADLSAIEVVSL